MSAALLCFELNHIFLFTAVSVTLSALHVWVLLCVQTRSLILGLSSFPALSGRQLLSLQWSCIHAPCDSLHSRSPIGQLFHSRERQNGEGSASRQRGSAVLFTRCPTRASFDWKIIIKKKKNQHVALSVYEQNKSRQGMLRSAPPFHPSHGCIGASSSLDAVTYTPMIRAWSSWCRLPPKAGAAARRHLQAYFISSVRGATRWSRAALIQRSCAEHPSDRDPAHFNGGFWE